MKKVLFLMTSIILLASLLFSCKGNGADSMKSKIESFFKDNLDNPSSYKLVSFEKIDSTTYGKAIFDRINYLKEYNFGDDKKISSLNLMLDTISYKNEIISRTYLYKFRCKNIFNSDVLNSYYIQTHKDSIINVCQSKDDLFKYFSDEIPGYVELILMDIE